MYLYSANFYFITISYIIVLYVFDRNGSLEVSVDVIIDTDVREIKKPAKLEEI